MKFFCKSQLRIQKFLMLNDRFSLIVRSCFCNRGPGWDDNGLGHKIKPGAIVG